MSTDPREIIAKQPMAGGTVTLIFIPLVFFMIPESVRWPARKQPGGAIEKTSAMLVRFGHAAVAAATGGIVLGWLTQRFGVKGLTTTVMLLSTVMVTVFAVFDRTPPDFVRFAMICAAAGFCTDVAITGMYAIFAQTFPTHARAFGTGFAVGVGRGGSVLAAIIASFLFVADLEPKTVAMTMVLGSLCAAGVLSLLRLTPDKPISESESREEIPASFGSAAAHGR